MLRVVLADDEKKVLLLMCKLIDWESLGFEIVGMASDGMHALEMIRDKQPHLLVTDIRMPGFDGIDLIRQAKQIQPGLYLLCRYSRGCILSLSAVMPSLNMRRTH